MIAEDARYGAIEDAVSALKASRTRDCLHVSIAEQRLAWFREGELHREWACSTGRRPPSNQEDSLGTPTGLHVVAEKIGEGAPAGMVFKGRRALGETFAQMSEEENERNLITSRILWLRGLQEGVNAGPGVDTHDRFIYIHGTNQEDRIGSPNSHGCVLLRNADVIELFDSIDAGTLVLIES